MRKPADGSHVTYPDVKPNKSAVHLPMICRRCKAPIVIIAGSRKPRVFDATSKLELIDPRTVSARGRTLHECRK